MNPTLIKMAIQPAVRTDLCFAAFMENGQVKVYTASVNESGIGLVSTRNATAAEKAVLQGNHGGWTEGELKTGTIITEIKYKPSSGAILKANPDKTTTILGSYKEDMANILNEMGNVKSTDFGPKDGSFNVLNVPNELFNKLKPKQFWEQYNRKWLDKVIMRGDDIILATKPEGKYLSYVDSRTGKEVITGFGREYNYLLKKGYTYDTVTNMMIRK